MWLVIIGDSTNVYEDNAKATNIDSIWTFDENILSSNCDNTQAVIRDKAINDCTTKVTDCTKAIGDSTDAIGESTNTTGNSTKAIDDSG